MTRSPIILLILLILGCGQPAAAPPSGQRTKAPTAENPASKTITKAPLPEVDFASADEAIAALLEAAAERDSDTLMATENWLVSRGDQVAAPIGEIFCSEAADLAGRIAACRVLRRLDSSLSKPHLEAGLQSSTQQIRLNAIKGLGAIKPTDAEIIARLVQLMDAEEQRTQREAILALGSIGPPANDAVGDRLVTILNDPSAIETLRDAAKRALQEINPRRTFQD